MDIKKTIIVTMVAGLLLGCGPTCPEVKAGLDATAAVTGDVTRVNELVARRKAVMAEAEQGGVGTFEMQRLKFSVTAYEMAIATEARVIKASPRFEGAASYDEAAPRINEFRCYVDKVLARDGNLVSDGVGESLRAYKAEIDGLLDRDGALSSAEIRAYFEEGIAAPPPLEKEAEVSEGEGADVDGAAGEDEETGDDESEENGGYYRDPDDEET
jgi:hypothetical protein